MNSILSNYILTETAQSKLIEWDKSYVPNQLPERNTRDEWNKFTSPNWAAKDHLRTALHTEIQKKAAEAGGFTHLAIRFVRWIGALDYFYINPAIESVFDAQKANLLLNSKNNALESRFKDYLFTYIEVRLLERKGYTFELDKATHLASIESIAQSALKWRASLSETRVSSDDQSKKSNSQNRALEKIWSSGSVNDLERLLKHSLLFSLKTHLPDLDLSKLHLYMFRNLKSDDLPKFLQDRFLTTLPFETQKQLLEIHDRLPEIQVDLKNLWDNAEETERRKLIHFLLPDCKGIPSPEDLIERLITKIGSDLGPDYKLPAEEAKFTSQLAEMTNFVIISHHWANIKKSDDAEKIYEIAFKLKGPTEPSEENLDKWVRFVKESLRIDRDTFISLYELFIVSGQFKACPEKFQARINILNKFKTQPNPDIHTVNKLFLEMNDLLDFMKIDKLSDYDRQYIEKAFEAIFSLFTEDPLSKIGLKNKISELQQKKIEIDPATGVSEQFANDYLRGRKETLILDDKTSNTCEEFTPKMLRETGNESLLKSLQTLLQNAPAFLIQELMSQTFLNRASDISNFAEKFINLNDFNASFFPTSISDPGSRTVRLTKLSKEEFEIQSSLELVPSINANSSNGFKRTPLHTIIQLKIKKVGDTWQYESSKLEIQPPLLASPRRPASPTENGSNDGYGSDSKSDT